MKCLLSGIVSGGGGTTDIRQNGNSGNSYCYHDYISQRDGPTATGRDRISVHWYLVVRIDTWEERKLTISQLEAMRMPEQKLITKVSLCY